MIISWPLRSNGQGVFYFMLEYHLSSSRFCNKTFCRYLNSLKVCSIFRHFKTSTLLCPSKHHVAPCAKVNMQCLWDMRTSNFISMLKSVGLITWQALILHTTLDLLHQCKKKTSPTSMDCCNVRRMSLPNTEGFSLTSIFFCSAHFPRGMFCDQDDLLSF